MKIYYLRMSVRGEKFFGEISYSGRFHLRDNRDFELSVFIFFPVFPILRLYFRGGVSILCKCLKEPKQDILRETKEIQ